MVCQRQTVEWPSVLFLSVGILVVEELGVS